MDNLKKSIWFQANYISKLQCIKQPYLCTKDFKDKIHNVYEPLGSAWHTAKLNKC